MVDDGQKMQYVLAEALFPRRKIKRIPIWLEIYRLDYKFTYDLPMSASQVLKL